MSEQTLKEKTAKGIFWGGVGSFLQQFVGMIFGIIIARILVPDDYGLVAMLAIFSIIANTIMDSGFTTALINRKNINHEDYNAVFWFSSLCGICMYVVLFVSANFIAYFYNQPILINLSRVLFLSFLFSSLGIAHNAFLFKNLMVKQRGIIDIIAVSISGVVGIVLALNGFSYWGLAIQQVIQSFISTSLRWYVVNWKPSFRINFSPIKEMFNFSVKVFLNNILTQVSLNIFSVLLGKNYSPSETGYYSQGFKWTNLGNSVISGMLHSVAQPVFVEVDGEQERQKAVFRKMLRFAAFVSFPIMIGLAFVAKEFVLITVGEKWINSVFYLRVFGIMTSFSFLSLLYGNLLFSRGKSNLMLYGNVLIYSFYLLLALFLISYGIYPLVIGCAIYTIFFAYFSWHFVAAGLINITFVELLKDISPYLFLSLLVFLLVYFITLGVNNVYCSFILKIVLSGLIYLFILWISKSIVFKDAVNYIFKKGNC